MAEPNNCAALLVDPRDDDYLARGEYYFINLENEPKVGIIHTCPCGCGIRSAIWFKDHGHGNPEWERSGPDDRMTLTPSIGIRNQFVDFQHDPKKRQQYHWHGYMRDGQFVEE